jgi:hypothetical protein
MKMSDKEVESKDYVHVGCLIDHLKNGKSREIAESCESLAISTIMNDEGAGDRQSET